MLTWVVIAVFLALALDPLVNFLMRLGIRRRGLAIAATFFLLAIVVFALGATFILTLVGEINDFIDAVPQYVSDLTEVADGSASSSATTRSSSASRTPRRRSRSPGSSACPAPPSP